MEQELVNDINKQLAKAEQAFKLDKYDLAIELAQQALANDPEQAYAYWLISSSYVGLEEYEKALATIKETIKLNPSYADAHTLYGIILFKLKRKREAEQEYKKAIELNVNSFFGRFTYAEFLGIYNDRYKEGLYQIEYALRIDPTDANALSVKGVILGKLKKYKQAEQAFLDSLAQDPENDITHHNYGQFLLFRNRPHQAYRHFKEAISLDPGSSLTLGMYHLSIKIKHPLYRWVWIYQLFMGRLGWVWVGLFFLALGLFFRPLAFPFFISCICFYIFLVIYASLVGKYLDFLIKKGRLK
ncbi:tetratricopeptide repeat protein [Hazenella coriacea]|uniref:Tetratricopeptide repeat protein n=1 Tax=Hazenella coriacea TaxID=1179467 RepID=A0A4R3L5U8_9BACL|nr:tetratricopeptide repeat protein [Hazenella coriacea]TCS94190.1 tetratricopeptide repeat protein [Hazenella coriacea]